jgi:ketosteroid isomerase-like protein
MVLEVRKMRCLPLLALACSLAALPALAQTPDQLYTASHQQLEVTKALLAQAAAWNHADLDAYVSFYKDAVDTEAILANSVRGLQSIRNAYYINFPRPETMGQLDESEVNVKELGPNFALATGRYHLTRNKKGGGDTEGIFSDVFEKTPAGWKIIFSESI